jgi:hypothetical protein
MIDDPLVSYRTLTLEQRQTIIARAHAERSKAVADGLRWLGSLLWGAVRRLARRERAPVAPAVAAANGPEPCCA